MTQENTCEKKHNIMWRGRFFSTRNITLLAMLSALSGILYLFTPIKLPFLFPSFLDMQFSDMPILLAGFMTGPIGGAIVVAVRFLLKILILGSSTGGVGELADVLIGLAFVLPAAFIYMSKRNRKTALIGILIGVAATVIVAVLTNTFMLIPLFKGVWGMDAIVGAVSKIFPNITEANFYSYYLPLSIVPFNLIRSGLCGAVTYVVYKPLSRLSFNIYKETPDGINEIPRDEKPQDKNIP